MTTLRYPNNLSEFPSYMILVRYKNEGFTTDQLTSPEQTYIKTTVGSSIGLPMPAVITDGTNIIWNDESDMSLIAKAMEYAKNYAGVLYNKGQMSTGITTEKHSAMLFHGVSPKAYSFSWKLIPRNRQEAEQIKRIIKELKIASLPTLAHGDITFKSPDLIKIRFGGKYKFDALKFIPSVITSVNVDWGDGNTFLIYQDGMPSEVTLSITVNEITSRSRVIEENF